MKVRKSKSRDLSFYLNFFEYEDPARAQQKIAGHLRAAKNNETITAALIHEGMRPPHWFAGAETLNNRSLTAQKAAPTAQVDEDCSPIYTVKTRPRINRSAALSARSSPPTYVYRPINPMPQTLIDPVLNEAYQLLKYDIEEDMRLRLESMKLRSHSQRTPRQKLTVDELKDIIVAINRMQKTEVDLNNLLMLAQYINSQMSAPKPIDIDELIQLFTQPLIQIGENYKKQLKERESANTEVKNIHTSS